MRYAFLLILILPAIATAQMHGNRLNGGQSGQVVNDGLPDTSVVREPPTPAQLMRQSNGSLLRATLSTDADQAKAQLNNISFFYVPEPEPRVLKKHDWVTIVIKEQSSAKSSGKADASKEMSVDAKLAEFVKLNLKNFAIEGGAQGATPPGIGFDYKRENKGDASMGRSDTLSDRIQAEVIDVKPNDTVVLQARRVLRNDDEEQMVVLSGVCRAEDITGDNTVLSYQLGDLSITRRHKGQIRDATRRGWLTRILDGVDPF